VYFAATIFLPHKSQPYAYSAIDYMLLVKFVCPLIFVAL
jgi:hypothetical protein